MPTYTITIRDDEGALSVEMAGEQVPHTTAQFLAKGLALVIPELVSAAKRAAKADESPCPCGKCQARRASAGQPHANDSKTTLH